jgi:hypothetical protein
VASARREGHDHGVPETWRYEADEDWLAGRRSAFFRRRRARLGRALADAELGPFAGAPRDPRLKLESKGYTHIRYALREYSYTTIQIDLLECRVCGGRAGAAPDGAAPRRRLHADARSLRRCRRCDRESWLFTSHMPAAAAGRGRDRKVVL